MTFTPYLSFQGQAAEAFAAYAVIFGGTVQSHRFADMPAGEGAPPLEPAQKDWLMHVQLDLPDRPAALMGADMPSQFGGAPRQEGVSIAVSRRDPAEARALFDRLAEGGSATMPFGPTFFAPGGFGMCRDRFGTAWMISTEATTEGA